MANDRIRSKLKILTAFDFNVTQLTVHWKILQIHWTGCCDSKSEGQRDRFDYNPIWIMEMASHLPNTSCD